MHNFDIIKLKILNAYFYEITGNNIIQINISAEVETQPQDKTKGAKKKKQKKSKEYKRRSNETKGKDYYREY